MEELNQSQSEKESAKKSKKKSRQNSYYPKKNKKVKQPSIRSNVTKKKYSSVQIDKLRTLVELQNQGERIKYYSIKVDGEFVVPKTDDPDLFDDFTQFVDQGTESVEVHLYHGSSNNCNKHILYFGEQEKSLQGVSPDQVNEIVKSAIDEERKLAQLELLEKEVEELREENEQLHELVEELQSKTDLSSLGDLAKAGLTAWMASNKKVIPLSGTATSQENAEVEVEIEAQDNNTGDTEDGLTEAKKKELRKQSEAFGKMYEQMGASGVQKVLNLADAINRSPNIKKGINELITKENEERAKQAQSTNNSQNK